MRTKSVGIIGIALLLCGAASADITIPLGGGWEATIRDEENVDLQVDLVGDDFIVLQKFARFYKTDADGIPLPQNIVFTQVGSDAETVSRIIITEEYVLNDTGEDWTGFQMRLGPPGMFNEVESADFSIDPFTTTAYTQDHHVVTYGGGLVAHGDAWNPGFESGGLVIDVDLSDEAPVKMIFREIPLVPAPGALALLGVAGVVSRRRRR